MEKTIFEKIIDGEIPSYKIYEDEHVVVFDKPAGLLSMAKGDYCLEPTLEDFGLLVHRLDRDTSGIVILAKDTSTQTLLGNNSKIEKPTKLTMPL